MPRKAIIVIECSRCHREEQITGDPKTVEDRSLKVMLGNIGTPLEYSDLCTPCYSTIKNCISMMLPTNKKSPIRKAKEAAPALPPATVTKSDHPVVTRAPRG